MADSHTQPKCCLFYFNPADSPLSALMLLVLHQSLQISRVGVLNSHILRVLTTTCGDCSVVNSSKFTAFSVKQLLF